MVIALLLATSVSPALAQAPDPHAGHTMPAPAKPAAPDPHAGHTMSAPAKPAAPDPHAGHTMSAPVQAADPHAGHRMPAPAADPHAGHIMSGPPAAGDAPPPVPSDHAAERFYTPGAMARAREVLRREHGAMTWTTVMLDRAEFRPSDGGDGFAWEGRVSYGGDIHRLVTKTEGDGASGHIEEAEVQALYSRAIGPYFNLQAGLRQDFQPRPRRTHAVLGLEGLAPYWIDVDGAVFLSNKGEVSVRFEASHDLRLTQRLVLESAVEVNFQAQDVAAQDLGSGLSDIEAGLRLRYAVTPEFSPYIGVNHTRTVGGTADAALQAGERVRETRLVLGLRAWF
ncbi:copper resistance protein B [Phenylobacterium sp.]|uniref:copper resistance protein B n=1 Tax=Phenylobacterium sp. TaxID=1871053 RepID=UPI0037C7695D